MVEATAAIASNPVWVDLSSSDAAASRGFYARLFGWQVHVDPDPQYGGYAIARLAGQDVAGIGPKQSPEAPSAWNVYIGSADADQLAARVEAAGGRVMAPPFDVGQMGRMSVLQDPCGAFISLWQPKAMRPFHAGVPNTFGWAELNARGVDRALGFYATLFGWTAKRSEMGEGEPPYIEFQVEGRSIAGAMEMASMVPAEVPSHWLVYFNVEDVDGSFAAAVEAGAGELVAPRDFPGGRFAVLSDPQGAAFAIMRMSQG